MTMPPDDVAPRDGIDRHADWLLGVACFVSLLTFLLPGVDLSIARHFPDDALFYNLIARNVVAGHGSTCDGLARTNGYHPLWMLVLTGIEGIAGKRAMTCELALIFLANAVAAFLLYRWLRAICHGPVALAVALLATFEQSVFQVTWSGMETTLAWLILIALLRILRAPLESLPRDALWRLRLALLGLMLARLDGGLLWFALVLVTLLSAPVSRATLAARGWVLFRVFLPPTLVVAAYLAINQAWYGTAIPISGRIKSIAPWDLLTPGYDWNAAWLRLQSLLVIDPVQRLLWTLRSVGAGANSILVVLWLALLGVALASVAGILARHIALRCLVLYAGLHTAYYSLLQRDPYSMRWARGPELLLMLVVAACVLERAATRARARRPAVATGVLALVIAFATVSHARRLIMNDRIYDFDVARSDFSAAVDFVARALPSGEPVITWNIGFLGYYTRRDVVSYDGLLNSREYFEEYLSRGRVADYMRAHGIRYIVNQLPAEGDPATLLARQFAGVRPDDLEVLAVFDSGVAKGLVRNRYAVARCRW